MVNTYRFLFRDEELRVTNCERACGGGRERGCGNAAPKLEDVKIASPANRERSCSIMAVLTAILDFPCVSHTFNLHRLKILYSDWASGGTGRAPYRMHF